MALVRLLVATLACLASSMILPVGLPCTRQLCSHLMPEVFLLLPRRPSRSSHITLGFHLYRMSATGRLTLAASPQRNDLFRVVLQLELHHLRS